MRTGKKARSGPGLKDEAAKRDEEANAVLKRTAEVGGAGGDLGDLLRVVGTQRFVISYGKETVVDCTLGCVGAGQHHLEILLGYGTVGRVDENPPVSHDFADLPFVFLI